MTNLIQIPAVKKIFEENGYATSFKSNDCIILPVVYQNIYKGALGEIAGRAILESNGIKLTEITDTTKFEKFDFCLANDPNVYIDFKNWSEKDKVNRNEYRNKCLNKLNKIKGKKVFVINLVADNFHIHRSCNDRVIEISCLCMHQPNIKLLYPLDIKDMQKVIRLLEACDNDNM